MKPNRIVLYIVGILLVSNCSVKEPTKELNHFNKPAEEKLDSTCNWLLHADVFTEPNYTKIFTSHLNEQVKLGHIDSAVKVIYNTSTNLVHSNAADTDFVRQIINFQLNHQQQCNPYETLLINTALGSQYLFLGEFQKAIMVLDNKNIVAKDYGTIKEKAQGNYLQALAYLQLHKDDSTLYKANEALNLFDQINDINMKGAIYALKAGLYDRLDLWDDALKNHKLGLSMSQQAKDSLNIFFSLEEITNFCYYAQNFSTLNRYIDSLRLHVKVWKPSGKRYQLVSESWHAYQLIQHEHYDEAEKILLSLKPVYIACEQDYPAIDAYLAAFTSYYEKSKRPIIDIEFIQSHLKRLEEIKDYNNLAFYYDLLSKQHESQGDHKKALLYLKDALQAGNHILQSETKAKLLNLDKKYQTATKEKMIAEQQAKLSWSKFQISALSLSLIGVILSTLLFFAYRKRKEAQAEVIRQQKFTDELIQNTEDERKRIATDLHDGVNHELLTLKNRVSIGKSIQNEDIEKVIHEVRQVSRDLYPAMFDHIGLKASIESLCERMTEAGLFTTCEIDYSLKLSKRNELQLYRIIQEALNNTLKHAKAEAARVTITTIENELQVEIKDNGIGFNTDEKMKSATSFGIQSVIQRARAMGGKSTIESNEQGTKLLLKTPIH